MKKEINQSEINQKYGTVSHTGVCLTFSRLAAKLSEMITERSSFDLNGLKIGPSLYLKSPQQ